MSGKTMLAIAFTVLLLAAVQPSAAAVDLARFEPLFRTLSPCQLFHLTERGYVRVAPTRFYVVSWSTKTVREMAAEARTRRVFGISARSTIHLQIAGGSSLQASTAFAALADFMRATGIERLDRATFLQAATVAYQAALERGAYHACFVMKWGNKRPDFFAQPIRRSTWEAIRAVFAPGGANRFPFTASEEAMVASGRLNRLEVLELRAIRIAAYILENSFATLKGDTGGWLGNLESDAIVCTDEATTFWYFVEMLREDGLIQHFESRDYRFVHRAARSFPFYLLPTDHFGVLLRQNRTGNYIVFDSWVEDGGVPPRISLIDDWIGKRDYIALVSIGDARLDVALGAGRVTHADKDGLLTALRTHLAPFMPEGHVTEPDGRPRLCNGVWCRDQPVDAW